MKIPQVEKPKIVVFTDLDGTLLDHETYAYDEAQEALNLLERRGIPLIFCSSKTRAEMEPLRRELRNRDPFIVENGAALFFPRGLFHKLEIEHRKIDGYLVVEMGIPYGKMIGFFREIKKETGLDLRGFSEMNKEEIAWVTGLPLTTAGLAKKREYTEPFLVLGKMSRTVWSLLQQAVRRRNLTLTRGGRFYHLTGQNDKGKAVRLLKSLFQKKWPILLTIGLGDSPNDFPMLENVDFPVLIRKKNGRVEKWSGSKSIIYSRGIGPRGWNESILNQLKEAGHE